jgi:hypothetical protein
VQKVEIGPKGFILGVKVELYGLVLGHKAGKRIPLNLGSQFATLGAKQEAKNAQSWP